MKTKSKLKATLLTMIFSIFNTVVVSILGLFYNYLIIRFYGSSTNGLISTLTQFVSLFSVIEGGFSVAAVVSSYDSIVKKDYDELNSILYTARKYLRRISVIFSVVSFLAGVIYLQFIDSNLSSYETISLLLITISTTTMSLGLVSSYTIVLSGHNSGYVTSFISIISRLLTWGMSIILIINKINIIFVYLFNFINVLLNVIFLKLYLKKHYPYVTYNGNYNKNLIEGTKDVLFQKIAGTVFTSTDLVLISAGISLSMASVYSLYNQIFRVVFNFLVSIVEAPFNSFGQLFSTGEKEKLKNNFIIFQKTVQLISTIFLSITGMTIIGFISIYTKSISDINYIIPSLVILFYSQFYLQLNNRPYGIILNASGNFKMQNIQCGLSVIINLVLSIILMKTMSINGVVIGSIAGTFVIMFMNMLQCNKHVIHDRLISNIFIETVNYIAGVILILASLHFSYSFPNYFILIVGAIANLIIAVIVVSAVNIILDRKRTIESVRFFYLRLKGSLLTKLNKKN